MQAAGQRVDRDQGAVQDCVGESPDAVHGLIERLGEGAARIRALLAVAFRLLTAQRPLPRTGPLTWREGAARRRRAPDFLNIHVRDHALVRDVVNS